MNSIRIRGARTHNLKNISLDLPRDSLVVLTGLSGSGKSSLAFDTLYAEGQRRYVESLSTYARQFLQLMEKPDVDLIEGLSPAISIEQKATSHNPRSTVGTVTEIHDYLRLLFARAGTPRCPEHDMELSVQTVSEMVDTVLGWPEETRIMILAPVLNQRKGEHVDLLNDLRAQGFVRIRLKKGPQDTPEILELDKLPPLDKHHKHNLDVVVDRLKVRVDARQRLAESFETALRISDGKAIAVNLDTETETVFSSKFACPVCDYSLTELEPRLFSFNNPAGACPVCDGLGHETFFDPLRVVAHPDISLAAGAISGWDRRNALYYQMIQSLAGHYGFDPESAWNELPEDVQHVVLYGSGSEQITFTYLSERSKPVAKTHAFEGILPNLTRRHRDTDSSAVRDELGKLMAVRSCQACQGSRLKTGARHVFIGEQEHRKALHQVTELPIHKALNYFESMHMHGAKGQIADKIVVEIKARLQFLNDVGLNYLTLNRSADTLSGGESQRIRLASQIGSGLTGVMYVLDEPSIGLHQRDNDRLIQTLLRLKNLGNTVLVVEHDEDAIRCADYVVDMGPGAGEHGGQIVAQGTPAEILASPESLTGQYLNGKRKIERLSPMRTPDPARMLTIHNATGNNLKDVSASIPVGLFVCVTGVSGSGKSTLINDTLLAEAAHQLNRAHKEGAPHSHISGLEHFDKVIAVDQSPIGRTPRSNPATYTGLFTPIRELFAGVPASRERGYDVGRFSFNVKGGRCEACQGDGVVKVEMHFLPDLYVPCDVCHGKRYNRETLEILYRGKSIAEVLELTVEQALEVFSAVPNIARKLQTLIDVGLGYIRLGQSATTLSGGEAQRVKLSLELSKRDTGKTLYILDEPTTGLHFHDIAMLLKVLNPLVEQGNTVLVIEHNLDVIKCADWVLDMGPEGGDNGGMLIAEGTPMDIAKNENSHTGKFLARFYNEEAEPTLPGKKSSKRA
ncbi:MAG: excinuclease ABC subunit UvrA [Gammaproteobacteria bacterium]|uniref:excinuclease ABC subunit UvrA n=1 Tax=Limnobacter sp. TaxID=2003368 RepID=UPI001D99B0B7|nr:excinuclease ABC subunit UvrA [Gammaproteobacteria bacterium]MBU0848157.1 excinuclease ABC subunit UvrA [Gammaproteobacteria bacterium]MBU1267134.1 excinuclease ABC subunit UvrA [Gammaproteobacteria bacterium]MBU1528830.1 excinuclease ABC subunit UvrA [Gammaproteobacteria bacterium]MBU1779806.1 excinuclease ABC subunit UvrA [Gammaproteobacteria bacterium]